MAGPQTRAIVTMKILIEEDEVFTMRVVLKLLGAAIDGTPSFFVAQEDILQAVPDLFCHLEQSLHLSGTRRALHLELIPVELIEVQQPAKDQYVHRHPHGAAPVGIPAEHSSVRLGRQIMAFVLVASHMKNT